MKTLSSFQFTSFVKSFTFFFVSTTVLWALGNYIAIRDVLVSWPVFAVNLTLSLGLGWWYYRYRCHTVLSYDDGGFNLRIGQRQARRRWDEFEAVSLVHRGNGEFVVRLYGPGKGEQVDIPATALKLNAQDFRFEVMAFVEGLAPEREQKREVS